MDGAAYSSTIVITRTPTSHPVGPLPDSGGTVAIETDDARLLIEEARQRHRRRLTLVGIIAVVAVVALGLLVGVVARRGGGAGTGTSGAPAGAGVFSEPTGDVLVFADGLSLDLDQRAAGRQPIAGQRAGDQRWDIVRSGNSLVVGWGDVWATSIAAGSTRLLGPVVTLVPAAERNAVWLIDYPGGRIGEGSPTLREVTTTGTTLRTEIGPAPSQGVPTVGIPGGLAFETSSGVALWDAATRRFTGRLGQGAGYVGDAAGKTLAWCDGGCTSLHITDLSHSPVGRRADRVVPSPQAGRSFDTDTLRISPEGRYVAAVTTAAVLGNAGERGTLDVVDSRTGRATVVDRSVSAWSTMAWSPDGKTLFFASDSGLGQSETRAGTGMTLGLFQPGSHSRETTHVAVSNAEPFVVLKRSQAGVFLTRSRRAKGGCGSEGISPGVPSPVCGPVRL
jgi:hypothetical protein